MPACIKLGLLVSVSDSEDRQDTYSLLTGLWKYCYENTLALILIVQTLIWCRSLKCSWQCVFRHDLSDHDSVWSVDTNTGSTLQYKWCDSASIFRSEVSRTRMPFGWACCTISTRYRPSLRITVLGQKVGCFISFLPNSSWARPASISFTTVTGIFCYYPYIHLEGMRKPTKSLNITCKQAILPQIFCPVQYLPARLCEQKKLVYRLNVSNHLLQ